ncbi:MAG: class II glutamine amidotransferase [Thermoguttaceae bacterium]|nr:class II glutamine amidotransferase [Thermoguttaceae bacterium]
MCELLAISSKTPIRVNDVLKKFMSHSIDMPNGWGLALFDGGDSVNLEKEPLPAFKSRYLRERIRRPIVTRGMMAHLRLATRGNMDYENCHPFVRRDNSGRAWTLIHNGTIFEAPVLDKYVRVQEGFTDSERILFYLVDKINAQQDGQRRILRREERFETVNSLVCELAPNNKLNLIIHDGELFYVHTNYKNSLFVRQDGDSALFSTVPLDEEKWNPVEFTTLTAYQEGEFVAAGTNHGAQYVDDASKTKYLYMDFAEL